MTKLFKSKAEEKTFRHDICESFRDISLLVSKQKEKNALTQDEEVEIKKSLKTLKNGLILYGIYKESN